MNGDPKRLSDSFTTLDAGLDAGWDAALLGVNQYASGINGSNRGGYFGGRDGRLQRVLSFDSAAVQSGFNGGLFQGALDYTASDPTQNSLIASIGGRLYRIWLHRNFQVSDISPVLAVLTTSNTTVPAVAGSVTIDVNDQSPVKVGDNIIIDSGNFTITAIGVDQITCTYNGNCPDATIASGTGVQDDLGNQIFALVTNYSGSPLVDLWSGQSYVFAATPGQSTTIFDGSTTTIANQSRQQLPSGWIGTYAWGRNWLANVNKRTYIASDLTGDPSGSAANGYADAILYVTENNLLSGGGSFSVPSNFGDILAMTTLPQLDNSLGMGPVLIGCQNGIFSNQAPTDRTTWQNLSYPIQSVAYSGFGPVGPRNHVIVNSDWWFRSADGIRQFMAVRRDFQQGQGSTPQSVEVRPYLETDEQGLLLYGSMMEFGNRMYATCNPSFVLGKGVIHKGLLTQNQDTISSMALKEPPVWESLHTGLDAFQCLSINDNGTTRGFILALNPDGETIDLWEIIPGQGSDVSFSTALGSNIIPAGTNFDGTAEYFPTLAFNSIYKLTFGANEDALTLIGNSTIPVFPVTPGQVVYINTAIYPNTVLIGNNAAIPVTASLQLVSLEFEYQPLVTTLDSRRMDFESPANLKRLITSELYLDEITDDVSVSVYFRPDNYPLWTLWATIPKCAPVKQCALVPDAGCTILWTPSMTQYAVRIMLPRPPETINPVTNAPINLFYSMQFRLVITGHARVKQFKPQANLVQQESEGSAPPVSATCSALSACPENIYRYSSYA